MSSLADVWSSKEFRALWVSRGLSIFGDQVARVALAVLVFDHTHSAMWTGFAYALTYLPFLAGPFVAGLADRRSRRSMMLLIDGLRALAFGVMAIPGIGLAAMLLLLVAATAVAPLYEAARSATLPEALDKERYPAGLAAMAMTVSSAQLLGFGLGGALVAVIGSRGSLGIDALTFAVSALLVGLFVPDRGAAVTASSSLRSHARATMKFIAASPLLRSLVAVAWINAMWMVPESLAAPYARHFGGGSVWVGVLMAALPLGAAVGAVVVARLSERRRLALLTPMGMLAGAGLLAGAFMPNLWLTTVMWVICGIGCAYNVSANAAFVAAVPNERRAQAFSLVTTGIAAGEGVAAVVAGAASSLLGPIVVVGIAGAVAAAMFVLLHAVLRAGRSVEPIDSAAQELRAVRAGAQPVPSPG